MSFVWGGPTFYVKLGPGPGFSGGVKVFCYTGRKFPDKNLRCGKLEAYEQKLTKTLTY